MDAPAQHREPRDAKGEVRPFLRLHGSQARAGADAFFMQKEEEMMKKRALSLLMAFVMVVGLLPTMALAADEPEGSGT